MKRRMLLSIVVLALFIRTSSQACVDLMDQQSFGVLFNNNEELKLDRFDSLGKEGIHFLQNCITIKPDPSTKNVEILTPTKDPVNWNDMFSIDNVSLTTNLLGIDVSYGGGCKTHEFILYVDSILIDGDPPVLNFTLLHNANGDACKAIVSETLVFNIKPVELLHPGISTMRMQVNNKMFGTKWYPDNTCVIKYRSHYSPELMVHLEYSPMSTEKAPLFPGMRIIMDPAIKYVAGIDYSKAIMTELQWLINNKVLHRISDKTLTSIKQKTIAHQGQFWTYQDSLIPYGAFFTITKDSSGEWVWGKMVLNPKRNCSSTLDFTLPPEKMISPTTTVKSDFNAPVQNFFSVAMINSSFTIDLHRNTVTPAEVSIIDLKGRILSKMNVPAHQNHIVIRTPVKPTSGVYQVIVKSKEGSMRKTLTVTD